jgi:hypothetical protein
LVMKVWHDVFRNATYHSDLVNLPAQTESRAARDFQTGRRKPKEMLKMQVDPDELLKTKGNSETKNTDPDKYLITRDIYQIS